MEQRPSSGKNGDGDEQPTPDLDETVDLRTPGPQPPAEEPAEPASKWFETKRPGSAKSEAAEEPPPRSRRSDQAAEDDAAQAAALGPEDKGSEPEPGGSGGWGPRDGGSASARPGGARDSESPSAHRGGPRDSAAGSTHPGGPRESEPVHAHHAAPPPAEPVSAGRRRLRQALWPPRFSRNQFVVGVLLAVLGAALAIQVHATNSDQLLRAARPDDLVHILDEVTARGQRLDNELRDLEAQKAALQNSTDKAQAALQQAQEKAKDLQILAGTTKASGPGITVTITDPQHKVNAAALLNALQELRAAGAEVVQLDNVRIVVSSAFLDTAAGQVSVDGKTLTAPYVFKVIGDPATLQPALGIPGGVVANLRDNFGATTTITSGPILVDAVAAAPEPQYAKPG